MIGDVTTATLPRIPPRVAARAATAATAVVGGLCLAASVPPWGWWPLAFVGVALWDRLLAGAGPGARFLRSWLLAVAWFGPSMLWMAGLTVVGYPVAIVAFAAYVGVAGVLVPGDDPRPWVRWLALPGALALAEVARWTFPFEGVPLATTAMSQADAPLGQFARVGASLGVVLLVGVGGVALSAAARRRWRATAVAVGLVLVAVVLASVAPSGRSVGSIEVALVQGGGPQGTRAEDTDPREVFERHLAASERVVTPVDLVVWPENVVDVEGPVGTNQEGRELSALARDLDTSLVVGVTEGIDSDTFVNAALVYLPDGTQAGRYEKAHRVPFGEYVPLRGFIEAVAGDGAGLPPRDAKGGTDPPVLDTPVGRMGVAISWEVFFADRTRAAALDGGEVLLNPTNGSSYWLTQVQTQQIASSRLRAIETGRWVLQAAPTGFSAVIDEDGRLLARTGVSEQAVIQRPVTRRGGETIATRFGPWPALVVALGLVAAAWVVNRRRPAAPPRAPS
jgi:apolipoprotein N-acyltransferase